MIPINTDLMPVCSNADISFKSAFSEFYEYGFMDAYENPCTVITIIINFKGISLFHHFVLETNAYAGGAFENYYRSPLDIINEAINRRIEITDYAEKCFMHLKRLTF